MFIALLLVTLAVAAITAGIVAQMFRGPIGAILERIVAVDIAYAWTKYLRFAVYVVGISGGVRIRSLEQYIRPPTEKWTPPVLTAERWILEVYRTIIESLQAIAWMLLVFFVIALLAYVIVRVFESRRGEKPGKREVASTDA